MWLSRLRSQRTLQKEPIPSRSLIRLRPSLSHQIQRCLRTPLQRRLRTSFPLGRTDEPPQLRALRHLRLIYGVGPSGARCLHGRRVNTPSRAPPPRPPPTVVTTPAPASLPVPNVPISVRPRSCRACGNPFFKTSARAWHPHRRSGLFLCFWCCCRISDGAPPAGRHSQAD